MIRQCVICGMTGKCEDHHVAGRVNNETAIITVCVDCHRRYLTPWQRCSGIPLKPGATDFLQNWSLAVGALHVAELVARQYDLPEALAFVKRIERAAIELFGDSVPGPTVNSRPAPETPAGASPRAAADCLVGMAAWFTGNHAALAVFFRLAEDCHV